VVIAILSLLVSILMPSLTKAKELARSAVCMSNLHQCAVALHAYAGDWGGTIVAQTTAGGGIDLWSQYIAASDGCFAKGATRYISNPGVFGCLSNANYDPDFVRMAIEKLDNYAYGICVSGPSDWKFIQTITLATDVYPWPFPYPARMVIEVLDMVPNPAGMVMLSDSLRGAYGAPSTDPKGHMIANFRPNGEGNWWARIHLIHDNRANYACYDGHVESGTSGDLYATASKCQYFFEQDGTGVILPP